MGAGALGRDGWCGALLTSSCDSRALIADVTACAAVCLCAVCVVCGVEYKLKLKLTLALAPNLRKRGGYCEVAS